MLYTYKLSKLVRDKIAENFIKSHVLVNSHTLDEHEYDNELRVKLIEEAEEVHSSTDRNEIIEELADLYEVIQALQNFHHITNDDIEKARHIKKENKGAFEKRLYIDTITVDHDHPARQYCLNNPEKYPEVAK